MGIFGKPRQSPVICVSQPVAVGARTPLPHAAPATPSSSCSSSSSGGGGCSAISSLRRGVTITRSNLGCGHCAETSSSDGHHFAALIELFFFYCCCCNTPHFIASLPKGVQKKKKSQKIPERDLNGSNEAASCILICTLGYFLFIFIFFASLTQLFQWGVNGVVLGHKAVLNFGIIQPFQSTPRSSADCSSFGRRQETM